MIRQIVAVSVALAALTAPAAAAASVPQGLGVTITDSIDETTVGDRLSYDVALSNDGPAAVAARVVVTIPEFLEYVDAGDAVVNASDSSWDVTIQPGESFVTTVDAEVGEIPAGELRVTTLVSVYLDADFGSPLIRSADSNRITGVNDPAHTVSQATDLDAASGFDWWIAATGGVLLFAIVTTVAFVLLRRARIL